MDEKSIRVLTWMTVGVVGVSLVSIIIGALRTEPAPGEVAFKAAERAFADHNYARALDNYRKALGENPESVEAMRGKARSLLQKQRPAEALEWFDRAIAEEPAFAGTYMNRGIAHDRLGDYTAALMDYEQALSMDDSVADGPGWTTRLLHMNEAPPTVADRAAYLREQLQLPPEERLLSLPEEDTAQRSYRRRVD